MTSVFFTESSKNWGGQEAQLLQQAAGLGRRGIRAVVLCRPNSRIQQEARKQGVATEVLGFRNAIDPASVMALGRLLKKHRPVAVICHSGHDSNLSALTVRLLAYLGVLNPRPKLIRMRTYQPGPAKAFTYNQLFDHTLTPSEALRDQLLNNPDIVPDKVGVLYPGIDFERIQNNAQADLPAPLQHLLSDTQRRPLIAHAAMLRGEKGHAFMLEVIAGLVKAFPHLMYVAAGEGPELESLQAQVQRLNLQQHVMFPGTLNPVAPLLKRADVVVMPSHYEPLGMSQIEALGLGTPVVVSRVGGLPETVQHLNTGHVCPPPFSPGAVEAWIHTLSDLLHSPQNARQLAASGQSQVQRQFGVDANLDQLLQLIDLKRLR